MRTYQPTLFCYLNHTFFGIAHFFQPALLAVLVYIVFHINQLQAATWGLIFFKQNGPVPYPHAGTCLLPIGQLWMSWTWVSLQMKILTKMLRLNSVVSPFYIKHKYYCSFCIPWTISTFLSKPEWSPLKIMTSCSFIKRFDFLCF